LLDPEEKEFLLSTLEYRIDDQNFLHIRIDKQEAYMGKLRIVEGGDAIAMKVKVISYPAKKEKIVEISKELIKNGY